MKQQQSYSNTLNKTNEKLMKVILDEFNNSNNGIYTLPNEDYPLSFEEFMKDIMQKYNEQSDVYDPSKYFRDSYKHMVNLDQPFQDSMSGKVEFTEQHYLPNSSPLKIKAKRVPRPQQPLISFGEQQQEIQELQDENMQLEIIDDRPLKPLQDSEYYSVNKEPQKEKPRNKSKDYLQKKQVQLLPCNLISKNEKKNLTDLKNKEQYLENKIKNIKKYVETNVYVSKQLNELGENEREVAKLYFANQLEILEQQIQNYQYENEKLRKERLDMQQEIKQFENLKNQWELQKQIQKEEFNEWKKKEEEKLATQNHLSEMAKKAFRDDQNKKYLDQIESLQKQIDFMKGEQNEKNEKLIKKKNKYQKYYKDMNNRVKDLQEEIIQLNFKIDSLNKIIAEYENNKEVQELILRQKQQAEKKVQQEAKLMQEKINQKQVKEEEQVQQVSLFELIENKDFILSINDINKRVISDEFLYDYNQFYKNYKKQKSKKEKLIESVQRSDGKTLKVYKSGKKEVVGMKGFLKEIFTDDYVIVHFPNKDIKQELPNGIVVYYFAQNNSTQTTLPKGINVLYFQNKQLEITYVDGSKQILFPDGTQKFVTYKGEKEIIFPDGVKKVVDENRIERTEFPDGTVKEKALD